VRGRLIRYLTVSCVSVTLTACPNFITGEEDPAGDVELCDVDPDSCLPDDDYQEYDPSERYEPYP
jgi:hypothetical protein